MSDNITKTNFESLVQSIETRKILLPDFQREFVWKKEEQQKKLVASVLSKMPIGSILLLKSPAEEYSSKQIGSRRTLSTDDITGEVQYLLDGQQRITVLSNVFSSVIYDGCDKVSDLVSQSLKKRFFLRLPKRSSGIEEQDLFGAKTLTFPLQNPDSDIPEFLSSDILPFIVVMPFNAEDKTVYNPKTKLSQALDNFCLGADNGYLVPLFLMIASGKERDSIEVYYERIAKKIATNIQNEIVDEFGQADNARREQILVELGLADCVIGTREQLEEKLTDKATLWKKKLLEYISACIKQMELMQIIVAASQRARAIDIYENLNLGGVSLSTFDLVMARVAKVDKRNFYKRITSYIQQPKDYVGMESVLPYKISGLINLKEYNATMAMGCYDDAKNKLSKKFIDVFLNVLSLYCNNRDLEADKFKVDMTKQEAILRLEPDAINDNSEKVLDAIDKALFFFQTRCGVRSIKEINYSLLIVIVAIVFMRRDAFKRKEIHCLLDGWYWSVLFSGEFDKDQTANLIKHLKDMCKTIYDKGETNWINEMKGNIFNMKNFSDEKLVLMEEAGRVPKEVLQVFVCQYQLARTYSDMFDEKKQISVFATDAKSLQAHHIVPLGSVKKIGETSKELRKDEKNICNSPINFVYITAESNREISSKSLGEYVGMIKDEAKSGLGLSGYNKTEILDSDEKIREFLKSRLDWLKDKIKEHVNDMLLVWDNSQG